MDIVHQSIIAGIVSSLAVWFLTHNTFLMVLCGSACGIIWLFSAVNK